MREMADHDSGRRFGEKKKGRRQKEDLRDRPMRKGGGGEGEWAETVYTEERIR